MQQRRANEPVRTSQAITPKAYISLALVGSVGLDDAPGQVNSGAQVRESRSVQAVPSAVQVVEFGRAVAFPRPAMRGVPPLSISIFV